MILIILVIVLCAAPAAAQDDPSKTAYDRSPCQMCHGDAGDGDVGPSLVPMTYEAGEFTGIVRTGVGHMPAIPRSEISDADLNLVFSFLKRRTADLKGPAAVDPASVSGPNVDQIRARIDHARRASDADGLAAAAADARTLAADADLASTYARFESIVQSVPPGADTDPRIAEALTLLQKITGALKEAAGPASDEGRSVFLEGVAGALSASGEGLSAAERNLRRAQELLPAKPGGGDVWPAWTAADASAWLGRVLAKKGDFVGARRAYQKALELEPNFLWVTKTLLPAIK